MAIAVDIGIVASLLAEEDPQSPLAPHPLGQAAEMVSTAARKSVAQPARIVFALTGLAVAMHALENSLVRPS